MGKAAIRIAEAAHYTNAGTVEFVVDDKGNYLLPRSQQAHPGRTSHHGGSHRD
jgi:acetyl/propionyl-CoA carboxylase alpha subunit